MWKWIVFGGGVVTVAAAILLLLIAGFRLMVLGWPMTANDGPPTDVARINEMVRASFGRLADSYTQIFTVVDGDYAVNASNLGEGWAMRAFRKTHGTWQSLHLFVNTDACSLKKAGFPDDAAQSIAHRFEWRMLHHGGEPTPCWTASSTRNSPI